MPDAIKATCSTNLDEYKHDDWPGIFVTVPRVGDYVRALSGHSLRVVQVTHLVNSGQPEIRVELHR